MAVTGTEVLCTAQIGLRGFPTSGTCWGQPCGACAASSSKSFNEMNLDPLRRALEPALRRVLHFYWRFARGLTHGRSRGRDRPAGRVFLVKHSYVAGWHLPGGGVETGETVQRGAGARAAGGGRHYGARVARRCTASSSTRRVSRRDHVVVFVVRDFTPGWRSAPRPRDRRPRLLRAGRAAAGHDARHARAARRGARRRAASRSAGDTCCRSSGSMAARDKSGGNHETPVRRARRRTLLALPAHAADPDQDRRSVRGRRSGRCARAHRRGRARPAAADRCRGGEPRRRRRPARGRAGRRARRPTAAPSCSRASARS